MRLKFLKSNLLSICVCISNMININSKYLVFFRIVVFIVFVRFFFIVGVVVFLGYREGVGFVLIGSYFVYV